MSKLTPTELSPSSTVYHWIPSSSGSAELRTYMFKCIPHFSEGAILEIPSVEVESLRWLLTLRRGISVFKRLRLAHVQKYFLPSWYVRKAKDDVVQKLLLLFLYGTAKEERFGAISNRLGNPLLHNAENYHLLISCRVSFWHAGKVVCVQA